MSVLQETNLINDTFVPMQQPHVHAAAWFMGKLYSKTVGEHFNHRPRQCRQDSKISKYLSH